MRPLLLFHFLAAVTALCAQQVQWLTTGAVGYSINPDLPNHLICASSGNHVYVARSTSLSYLYNSIYGGAVVEQLNAQGGVNWSFQLGDSVLLQSMATDANGRVIVGGRFFRKVHLNGDGGINTVNGTTFPETFLFALDVTGALLWQRNITLAPLDQSDVQAITFDPQGRAWYATCDFFHADIKRVDDAGNDVETRPIADAKSIGSLSFDPWGGLYVSGSASTPGITINGTFYPLAPQYNFFVARMGQDGSAQWLRSAADVTFQRPRVAADNFGHAYFSGTPFDSLSWGNLHFHGPEWNSTFFLARMDSLGGFQWGFQPPLDNPFSGQFDLDHGQPMGVDAQGGVMLLGITNGLIHWGGNVVTDAGSIQERAVTLLRMDSTGAPQWELHGGSTDHDVTQGLSVLPDGTCHLAVLARDTFPFGAFTAEVNSSTLVVARVSPEASAGLAEPASSSMMTAFPSPCSSTFSLGGNVDAARLVTVRIFDASGRVVEQGHSMDGLGQRLLPGCYIVEAVQGGRKWRTKVVKQ